MNQEDQIDKKICKKYLTSVASKIIDLTKSNISPFFRGWGWKL